MHMSLCFHSTSKATEMQAKQRLRRLSAVEPRQSTPTLKESGRVRQHNININAKSGEKTAKVAPGSRPLQEL